MTNMTNQQVRAFVGDALQRLVSSMLDQGERRGVLHIRPMLDSGLADYELEFAVTVTIVPDSKKRPKQREAPKTKDRERRGYRRLNA